MAGEPVNTQKSGRLRRNFSVDNLQSQHNNEKVVSPQAQASVDGFGTKGGAKGGNGQYEERHRDEGGTYFEKVSGTQGPSFIYRLGTDRWCIGPVLDGDLIWAEKKLAEAKLPLTKRAERWEINSATAAGSPDVSVFRPYVKILSGQDLRPADLNGLSDPYVIVEIPDKLKFKTPIIKKNLNPFWGTQRTMDGYEVGDQIFFTVMDWDADDDDDKIGEASFNIRKELTTRPAVKVDLPLTLPGARKGGTLTIEVFVPNIIKTKAQVGINANRKIDLLDDSLDKLIYFMSDQEKREAWEAVRAAATMEARAQNNEEVQTLLIAAGAADHLVALLSGEDPQGRSKAAGALKNLAGTNASRAVILAAGAVAELVKLISGTSSHGKEEAMEALEKLAYTDQARLHMLECGVVPLLVAHLTDTGGPSSRVARAAAALGAIAATEECGAKLIAEGGIPPIVALLSSTSLEQRIAAAIACRCIGVTNGHRKCVSEAGALTLLVAMLSGDVEERTEAAATLAALSQQDDEGFSIDMVIPLKAEVFVEAGVLAPLVNLLTAGSVECKARASNVLFNISSSEKNQEALLAAGAVTPLVALLLNGIGPKARSYAAGTLRQLASTEESRRAILSAVPRAQRGNPAIIRTIELYCF